MQSREDTANKVLQDTGAVLIPSSNDRLIISGQGTISLELLEQASEIDTLIVPISGGGMISGVALAGKAINPAIRILAAEPMGVMVGLLSYLKSTLSLMAFELFLEISRGLLSAISWMMS